MPRIPLYNKGLGGSAGMTTGASLGPRANPAAFTASGQSLANLGESTSQIMFDFYDADQKAKAKTSMMEAENELTKVMVEYNNNDKSTSMAEYDNNFKKNSQNRITKIASKYKLRPNEQKALVALLNDKQASLRIAGLQEANNKQKVIRGQVVSDTLTRYINEASTTPDGHPDHIRANSEAFKLIDESQRDGTIRFSPIRTVEQFDNAVKDRSFLVSIDSVDNYQGFEEIEKKINTSSLPIGTKNKLQKKLRAEKHLFNVETLASLQDQIEKNEPNYRETEDILKKLENNEPVDMELSNGKRIVIEGNLPQNVSNTLQSFVEKEGEDKLVAATNEISSEIITSAENDTSKNTLLLAKKLYQDFPNKEQAEAAINSAATTLYYKAKTLLDEYKEFPTKVNVKKITDLTGMARSLIQEKYGNVAIIDQTNSRANQAKKLFLSLGDVDVDVQGEINKQVLFRQGVNTISTGQWNLIKDQFPPKDQKKIIKIALSDKSFNDKVLLLEKNHIKDNTLATDLEIGKNQILSENPDMDLIKLNFEKYNRMKIMSNGVLQNHLKDNDIAIYNSVNLLVRSGKSFEEAVNLVKTSYASDIDIRPKMKNINQFAKEVISEKTDFFGPGKVDPSNSVYVQQRVKDLAAIYLKTGMNVDLALENAAQDVKNSHINHKGILIPRSANMNEDDIRKYADILIENYKEKYKKINNKEFEGQLAATPVTGLVDRWIVYVTDESNNTFSIDFENGRYTLDELKEIETVTAQRKAQEKRTKIIKKQKEKQKKAEAFKSSPAGKEEERKAKIREKSQKQIKDLLQTNFKLPPKTQAQIKQEEEQAKIRKENQKMLRKNFPVFYGERTKD